MDEIAPITVEVLSEYSGLDGENADNYFRAGQRNALLYSEIINPFETALKDFTDYDDNNIPKEEMEITCELGGMNFVMNATPSKKRPGYKEVFEDVDSHLRTKLAEYNANERPVGIITLDGQPYISAEDVLKSIGKKKRQVTSKGTKIAIAKRPVIPSDVNSIVVPLGMDLSELTEGNAMRYLEACGMAKGYKELISAFEEELLGLTGFNNGNPPEQTEHMYKQIGSHIFHVKSVPVESTSYGKVISGLDANPGKKKPENGGDLTLVTKEIDVPRLSIYKTKIREGDHLIKLKSLIKRMDSLVKANTDTKTRHPMAHYPVV
jgi:hypothetical protein